MKLNPHFAFNGNCAEAMDFYQGVFNGTTEVRMTWGESPMADQVPDSFHDKIMHWSVNIGGATIMGADAPPGRYKPAAGTVTAIEGVSPEEARTIFDKLADGGTVTMPFETTFWSKGFGMLVDRYGIPWTVNS